MMRILWPLSSPLLLFQLMKYAMWQLSVEFMRISAKSLKISFPLNFWVRFLWVGFTPQKKFWNFLTLFVFSYSFELALFLLTGFCWVATLCYANWLCRWLSSIKMVPLVWLSERCMLLVMRVPVWPKYAILLTLFVKVLYSFKSWWSARVEKFAFHLRITGIYMYDNLHHMLRM